MVSLAMLRDTDSRRRRIRTGSCRTPVASWRSEEHRSLQYGRLQRIYIGFCNDFKPEIATQVVLRMDDGIGVADVRGRRHLLLDLKA